MSNAENVQTPEAGVLACRFAPENQASLEDRPDCFWEGVHEYLGGTVRGLAGLPLKIGGVEDHVHALIGLKPTHCISDFVRELKKATSTWAATHHESQFQWQEGYSIFAVSVSAMDAVTDYIARQEEHHRQQSFAEELKMFLEKHRVEYDPKYLL